MIRKQSTNDEGLTKQRMVGSIFPIGIITVLFSLWIFFNKSRIALLLTFSVNNYFITSSVLFF